MKLRDCENLKTGDIVCWGDKIMIILNIRDATEYELINFKAIWPRAKLPRFVIMFLCPSNGMQIQDYYDTIDADVISTKYSTSRALQSVHSSIEKQ